MIQLPRKIRLLVVILSAIVAAPVLAQNGGGWKASSAGGPRSDGQPAGQVAAANAPAPVPRAPVDVTPVQGAPPVVAGAAPGVTHAAVSKGSGALPQDKGQVWREYDIRPYTQRVGTTTRPEQMIVDWILRETGYEAWHSEPVGLLSANHDTLRVYHTPEMQAIVADIVDRFVNQAASAYGFTMRVATVGSPNWRAKAIMMMTPIPVQSPGIQGWLLAKENARLLVSELSRRTDYREYNSPQQIVANGQSVVLSTMRPRSYIRSAIITQNAWPGYQPEMGTIEEGFSLEFSPLLGLDLASADAVVKLRLNQVEKMLPVKLDLPTVVAPNQRVQIDVPQMTSSNLHERFRWPTDKVLLLSMGVVATPGPTKDNPISDAVTDAVPILKSAPRADALLFVENAGIVPPAPEPPTARAASLPQPSFQGRY